MNTTAFLSRLHGLGIKLRVEGDRLRIEAAEGALTAELRGEIEARESDLIDLLREMSASVTVARPITRLPEDAERPLSFAQERFWFLCELEGDTSAYSLPFVVRLRGPLDAAALQWCLGQIVRRHDVMRTTFAMGDHGPVQVVDRSVDFSLPRVDLSGRDDPLAAALDLGRADAAKPFDLAVGPLYRFELLRLGATDHVLLINLQHAITDGLSIGILSWELTQLYAARVRGAASPLPELAVQFADYAAWQRERYASQSDGLVRYWVGQLGGAPTLDLPTDHPRPARQSFSGRKRRFTVPDETVSALKAMGRKEGWTLFMVVLGAWKMLLSRYARQEDIVVGTPAANRSRPELEAMIGPFLNTLVLRTDLSGGPSFRELMGRIREVTLGAFEHQDMPFEQLVVELRPERDLSRNPVFQVMFNMLDAPADPALGEVVLEALDVGTVTTQVDLSLTVGQGEDGFRGFLEYNTDLFDDATAARMEQHLALLLAGIAADPSRGIQDYSILTDEEQQRVLVEPNATAREYARDKTTSQLFEAQVERSPDAVAVTCGSDSLTYAELNARANKMARHLRGLGAGPDILVGVLMQRSLDMLVALLAIQKSGAAYVPLDPNYPADRVAFIVEDAGIELMIAIEGTVPGTVPSIVRLDRDAEAIAAQSAENLEPVGGPENLAYVIFTSGSTGKPKGVQIEHRALVNFLSAMAERPGISATDVLVAVTTISFDIAGLELYLPLLVGARIELADDEVAADGRELGALLDRGATIMQATPATWRLLVEAGWKGSDRLKALCGGEALPRELAEQLLPLVGELWNMYGPTETTIWSLVGRVTSGTGPVPIGTPIANTEIYLLDRHQQPVPIGVPGQLYLGGDGLARGYWVREELTAEKFVEHPFSFDEGARLYDTGDLARYRVDGSLEFLGRVDHQVKIRGFRIELGEIESVLASHPAVAECAVVPHTKPSGDSQLVAHVVFAPDATATASELREVLRAKLPDYMVPPTYQMQERLPLTPNGKVDRNALARSTAPRLGSGERALPPSTPMETLVADAWKHVLEIDQVGRHDNFFELGGHSLLIMQLRRRLQQQCQQDLSVADVFQYPTVATMAAHLSGDTERASFPAVEERMRRRRAATGGARCDDIAIVGMAGRFPGARNVDQLWENLAAGVESISFFSDDELRDAGVPAELIADPNYIGARAKLDDVELFDAGFFGIPVREAQSMDPQHRLFLESAYEAIENAGYDPLHCPGAVGVWAGSGPNSYFHNFLSRSREFAESTDAFQMALTAYGGGFLATRVSYKLDLKGPSVEVQTACSTSMVAVVQACQSLRSFQCDMALAGGVAIALPRVGYLYQEGLIFSPDGHCRPFSAKAQGTTGGEGVGLVVLKRLDDARADGDHIRAVIRGAAMNNDGSLKVGFTAPSVDGQSEVIAAALAEAEVEARSISYVEAHGTATPLGDPIEIAALTRAFRAHTDDTGFCAVGSIKSNFGHADAAAGIAGLIKTVLALEHAQIPASLHYDEPNPEIDLASTPFYVAAKTSPWQVASGPRRAGVSSFGFGGTNSHVVLEEAPQPARSHAAPPWHLLLLSAKSEAALASAGERMAAHLSAGAPEGADLADVAFTTQMSRGGLSFRRAVVCHDLASAGSGCAGEAAEHTATGARGAEDPPVVFMFPGQGAQHVQMGRGLYETAPVFREQVDLCARALHDDLGLDLRELLYPTEARSEEAARQLAETRFTQPAVFVVEYALAKLWMSLGVRPTAMIGHSVGEYVAACLAGVLSLPDALRMVAARGKMMQELPGGDMLSVGLPEEEVRQLLAGKNGNLSLAAVNGPSSCVVSGPAEAVSRLQSQLAEKDLACRPLITSHAFHSAMMDPIVEPFAAVVRGVTLQPAQIPCVSTVTGDWIAPEDWADPDYWTRNLRQPVRFADGARALLAEADRVLLEIGPGQTLTALVRQQGSAAAGRVVRPSMRHPKDDPADQAVLLDAAGALWIAGVEFDWAALHVGQRRRRVPLPSYPFERERYWVEPSREATMPRVETTKRVDVGRWFWVPTWKRAAAPVSRAGARSWVVFVDERGLGAKVVARLRRDGESVLEVRAGAAFAQLDPHTFALDPRDRDGHRRVLEALREAGGERVSALHMWGVAAPGDAAADSDRAFHSVVATAAAANQVLGGEIEISVVTNGLQDAAGTAVFGAARATVHGACAVIPQELPLVRCRSVDVDPQSEAAPRQILAEARSEVTEPVVAYRGRFRWVQAWDEVALPAPDDGAEWRRGGGVCLITGGLGGIGMALGEALVEAVGARLVLVGRTDLPPRGKWDAWLQEHGENDRQSRRIAAVQALEAAGAEVMVECADVTDRPQMQAVVDRARKRFGAVHGVIHAAGIMSQHMVEEMTPEDATAALAPKVQGAEVLAEVFAGETLDFMLLCSSVSTMLGGFGLAHYSASNCFLDTFALGSDGDTPVVSVDWDAWADVGMAVDMTADLTDQQRSEAAKTLALSILAAEGKDAFLRVLGDRFPRVAVATYDLAARIDRARGVTEESQAAETEAGLEIHERPKLSSEFVAPQTPLETDIAAVVQDLVGVDEVGIRDNLFDLGFDSLMAHRMIGRLKERLGTAVPLRVVLETPRVEDIAKHVEALRWAAAASKMK